MLVPADIYRPAAIDQLKVLAASIEVDCYNSSPKTPVQEIVKAAQAQAKKEKYGKLAAKLKIKSLRFFFHYP